MLSFLQKLFMPKELTRELLASERARQDTLSFAKWLRKQYAYFSAACYERKTRGLPVPQSWLNSLILVENEIDEVKKRGGANLFPANMKKASDDFK